MWALADALRSLRSSRWRAAKRSRSPWGISVPITTCVWPTRSITCGKIESSSSALKKRLPCLRQEVGQLFSLVLKSVVQAVDHVGDPHGACFEKYRPEFGKVI